MIKVKEISKSFGAKKVLENISFDIEKGKPLFIAGKSGIGKTTFINIILGLEKADSGVIEGMETLKKAVMFQEDRLCENISAVKNIKITCKKSESEIKKAFERVGFNNEDMFKPVKNLSGGMKRRVSFVRCMLYDGEFIIMDEPFKGLDTETKRLCQNFLKENISNKYCLIITHDLTLPNVIGGKLMNLK